VRGAAVRAVVSARHRPIPLEELRLRAFDIFQVIKPREATLRPVVIVDIDEPSLRKLGQCRGRARASPT
jgi:CHASE2 domain-containing sensor protein